MADEKAPAAPAASDAPVTLFNRGKRIFDTIKDGKKFRHAIGSIATYAAKEAAALKGYADLVDVSKIPGSVDKAKLEADNAALKADKERLEKEIAALKGAQAPAPSAPEAPAAPAADPAPAPAPAAEPKKKAAAK